MGHHYINIGLTSRVCRDASCPTNQVTLQLWRSSSKNNSSLNDRSSCSNKSNRRKSNIICRGTAAAVATRAVAADAAVEGTAAAAAAAAAAVAPAEIAGAEGKTGTRGTPNTAVTADFNIEQLLLFTFALQSNKRISEQL